ncbi:MULTISPECIES: zinc-binding alcohol dehydrogenase family protein [Lacticaseibacillus]|uniref:Alcohol dehydrogenase n=2 Tax=Lacticaseibacillus TaxID=2759736 RepID=A0AAN1C5Z1_LACCA|nr:MULTISPECIES: zinc-binding alcohol dehydrogenase family protein [Lacticaseibacillus]ARY90266.1 alcohol dehydrogenase [Lacticaseibacillus casei]KAB1969993.1 zinc-binding alcohol dehydrogenase family protein [Lacticaseibacillus casei]WLV80878.1 zinc-binding alcohol dehydrogenase family protein [Lacticaseibacillus sp. NCIMB 15473]WNX24839.1 zinc-binding alcohol dehydrogenase family protein [Lacticaseibacillus casei]WNX27611.1 zinc-binding alcohol dehydrogenase family protein [Lacticaseibacillu
MLAARVYGKEDIRVEEVPKPSIKSSKDVLIKVKAVGICGSDNHIYHGENPFATLPRVMGHEFVGEVVETGEAVSSVAVGDHAVIEPINYPEGGKDYAVRQGMPNVSAQLKVLGVHVDGGMQEYISVPERQVYKIDKNIPWTTAVLAEPYTIAGNSTTRGQVGLGKMLVVQGAGTIGQLILRVAKAKGATVLISDVIDSKLEFAKQNGADRIVNANKEDLVDAVRDWTNGEMANVVIDAVGAPKTFETCFDLVSVAGAIVPLGMSPEPAHIAQKPIMQKQLTIYGSRLQAYQFAPIIKAIENGQIGNDGVVTQEFNIKDVQKAFDLMNQHPEKARKIILTFD